MLNFFTNCKELNINPSHSFFSKKFSKYSFLRIKLAYHKVHPCKVYNPVVFSMLTKLCKCHISHIAQQSLVIIPASSCLLASGSYESTFCSIDLPIVEIWINGLADYVVFSDQFLLLSTMISRFICIIPFDGSIISHSQRYQILFINTSFEGHQGCFIFFPVL